MNANEEKHTNNNTDSTAITRIKESDINVNDVICGGTETENNNRPGNRNYNRLIKCMRTHFLEAKTDEEKIKVARAIVDSVHKATPRGRFLLNFHNINNSKNKTKTNNPNSPTKSTSTTNSKEADEWWFEISDQSAWTKTQFLLQNLPTSLQQKGSSAPAANKRFKKEATKKVVSTQETSKIAPVAAVDSMNNIIITKPSPQTSIPTISKNDTISNNKNIVVINNNNNKAPSTVNVTPKPASLSAATVVTTDKNNATTMATLSPNIIIGTPMNTVASKFTTSTITSPIRTKVSEQESTTPNSNFSQQTNNNNKVINTTTPTTTSTTNSTTTTTISNLKDINKHAPKLFNINEILAKYSSQPKTNIPTTTTTPNSSLPSNSRPVVPTTTNTNTTNINMTKSPAKPKMNIPIPNTAPTTPNSSLSSNHRPIVPTVKNTTIGNITMSPIQIPFHNTSTTTPISGLPSIHRPVVPTNTTTNINTIMGNLNTTPSQPKTNIPNTTKTTPSSSLPSNHRPVVPISNTTNGKMTTTPTQPKTNIPSINSTTGKMNVMQTQPKKNIPIPKTTTPNSSFPSKPTNNFNTSTSHSNNTVTAQGNTNTNNISGTSTTTTTKVYPLPINGRKIVDHPMDLRTNSLFLESLRNEINTWSTRPTDDVLDDFYEAGLWYNSKYGE